MTPREIASRRMRNQGVTGSGRTTAADAVGRLGALQAQNYGGALWAIGMRMRNAAEASIMEAIEKGEIVRTWPMRGTLHFVPAEDVRWMLRLLTPRVLAASEKRQTELELDIRTFRHCEKLVVQMLGSGDRTTREGLLAMLARAGIRMDPHRGYHILWRLGQEGVICFGPRAGRQPTFVLLDEWVPHSRAFDDTEEAAAELARRYFTSHGPATARDFAWWSGLRMADAQRAAAAIAPEMEVLSTGAGTAFAPHADPPPPSARAFLLPGFDELLLGYRDRSPVLAEEHAQKIVPGNNGIFLPTMAWKGRIRGTWKLAEGRAAVTIHPAPFGPLGADAVSAFRSAARRYGAFRELPARWSEPFSPS